MDKKQPKESLLLLYGPYSIASIHGRRKIDRQKKRKGDAKTSSHNGAGVIQKKLLDEGGGALSFQLHTAKALIDCRFFHNTRRV